MTRSIRSTLVGLMVAGLAGCSGQVGNSNTGSGPGNAGSTGTPGTAGSTGTPGTAGSTGTPGTAGTTGNPGTAGSGPAGNAGNTGTGGIMIDPGVTLTCKPGIPATSQVPRMTTRQYDTVIQDLLGVTTLTDGNAAPSSLLAPDSSGSVTAIGWDGYLLAAEKIAAQVMANATTKAKFISCDPAAAAPAGTTCLQNTIKTFGRKAFRRPLTDAEVTSFMKFDNLTPKGTPAEVAEGILYAFLASPSFIMLPELAQDPEGSAIKLNSYEIAARLSFLFWNSVPDQTLSDLADMNMLTTQSAIAAQAQRLLASPKAAAVASTFHKLYADMQNSSHWVNNTTHDAKFTKFTAASYVAGIAEIDSFFQDVVTSNGTFASLFTSPVGFVTKDTAPIYGLNASDFTTTAKKTTLDATKRPGFLTRVGFLSTFSHPDSSSPILRGAFITGRVLGIPTGTPDPSFIGRQPPAGNYMTQRDANDALTMPSPCNTCHTTKINPPGYVLERYNSIGEWQDTDQLGGAINSTADVYFSISPEVKKTISTPAQLMTEIAAAPKAQRSYATIWVAFAAGRNPNENDACTVDKLATNMSNAAYTVPNMMADFTQSDSFRLRTLGN